MRFRFVTFPKVLCVVLFRFVFDKWVPKKLNCEFDIPHADDDYVNFDKYKSETGGKVPDYET